MVVYPPEPGESPTWAPIGDPWSRLQSDPRGLGALGQAPSRPTVGYVRRNRDRSTGVTPTRKDRLQGTEPPAAAELWTSRSCCRAWIFADRWERSPQHGYQGRQLLPTWAPIEATKRAGAASIVWSRR